jgi:solute carrier family 25 phosphate transporter 23/24/25/41
MSNLKDSDATASRKLMTFDDLLDVLVDIYNLPKYSDQIKDTAPNTLERNEKILELQLRLSHLYNSLHDKSISEISSLNPTSYNRHVEKLKKDCFECILTLFPSKPIFKIIYETNLRLGGSFENICEQMNMDMTAFYNDRMAEKTVKNLLKDLFHRYYDSDGNGSVTLTELEKIFNNMNLPSSMALDLMDKVDSSKDGIITYEEFEQYSEKQIVKSYRIFMNLDSDGDGKLDYRQTKQSLHEIYPSLELSDDIYKNLFFTMDQDKSGFISFEEWCKFLFLFPQMNLEFLVTQWKLYSLTTMDPQQPSNPFFEKDIKVKKGVIATSYWDILKVFVCGGISGGISRTITSPLERLKLLYQTTYTETKTPTVMQGLQDVYKKHGFVSLFKGNSLSIFMSVLEQALRFAIIEYSKTHFQDDYGHIDKNHFLYIGVITGILSSLIIFPFDVVRIRMITSQEKHTVITKIKKIYHNFGYAGFYMGLAPHLISVLPSGSLNVFFYNNLKKFLVSDKDLENPKVTKFMFLGGFAAYITGTVTYPFNLITSRMIFLNRDVKIYGERVGFIKAISNTYKNEGFSGFFKGYTASILRVFIGQSINFGTYEILKYKFVSTKKNSNQA